MRDLSQDAIDAIYAESTSAVFLHLLTIDHDDLSVPVRFVDNLTDITSRGDVYTAMPFRVAIPSDITGELPRVEIMLDNIGQALVDELRSIASPLTATLEIILAADPDTVEAGPWNCTLKQIEYDALTIRLELGYEDVLNEPFPVPRFTPTDFPGLFNAVDT